MQYLSKDCIQLLEKAEKIVDVNILHDEDYHVAVDHFKKRAEKGLETLGDKVSH